MTMPLGSKTVTNGVTGFFDAPTMGLKGLIIGNESPYTLMVTVGIGQTKTLYPETVDFFTTGQGFNGNVTYVPSGVLTNPTSYTASTITFDAVGINENIDTSVYPLALTRPAVNPTATGQPIFSATYGNGNTQQLNEILCVFNPANSGVILTFHSARCFDSNASTDSINLQYHQGSDLNFGIAIPAVSHSGTKNPPVSVAHCTAADTASFPGGDTDIEIHNTQQNITVDLLTFPDTYLLYPGGCLYIALSQTSTNHIVRLTLKWTENVLTPPIPVTGATAVANSIRNDNNPVGTSIIEATPQGAPQAVQLFNDGTGFYAVDQSGIAHRVFTFNSSGNPLQQGASGDVMEFLGQMLVDQLATFTGDIAANGAGTGLAVANNETVGGTLGVTGATNLTGLLTAVAANFSGLIQPNQAASVVNGSVAGNVTFYAPVWGSGLKILVVAVNAFNSATIAQFNFASNLVSGIGFMGNLGATTWGIFGGSGAQTLAQINGASPLGSAGTAGTSTGETTLHSNNLVWFQGIAGTNFQVGTTAGAISAAGFFVGI